MLAQNFKSHTDLGISETEHVGLLGVLGMLERDEIRHVSIDGGVTVFRRPRKPVVAFNMGEVFMRTDCGTAACIAGSSDWFFGTHFARGGLLRNRLTPALEDLFMPSAARASEWRDISAEQAATALRSYLTTGDANWAEALAPQ